MTTYSVSKLHLKDRAILFGQLCTSLSMSDSELQQIPEDWQAWNLRYVFNLWGVDTGEVSDDVQEDGYDCYADCLTVYQSHSD